MKLAIAALALVALSGCNRDDLAFGNSYDACILRNATKGGDEQSRSTATDICERHFVRAASVSEQDATRTQATVRFAKEPPSAGPQDPLDQAFAATDQIVASIQNPSANLIIKEVRIEAYFHQGPPTIAGGKWPDTDPPKHVWWDLKTTIGPGEADEVTGGFGGQAPSRFYKAFAYARMVVPQTRKPVSRLVEDPG